MTRCAIGGLGFGLALSAVVVNPVPASQVGAAAGMNANERTIGGAVPDPRRQDRRLARLQQPHKGS